jgi:hypothetical protein
MSKMRYILLVALVALLSVACQRRPMDEEYLKVYLDLTIDKKVTNHEYTDPGLMRVAFFDSFTGEYLSHDYVESTGGYIFAPYGTVDMVVYNLDAGQTHIRNYYVWNEIEAYTYEIDELSRGLFTRYLQSRVDTRPSYDNIRETPGHLYVARERNIYIPRHITEDVFIIQTTAKSVVESWTVEIESITGMEYVGSVAMMISGQVGSHFIATDTDSSEPVALYFDIITAQRRNTVMTARFETFGREKTSGDVALLSILFIDVMGHPYMFNFDVSDQMENNEKQHIYINADINIPKPEVGGGFKPEVGEWEENVYDIEI